MEENMMTLEHLQPGRYVAVSMTDIRVPGKTVQSVQEKLAALQQVWDDYSGGTMLGHHGKHYGNGPVGELDGVFPYQDEAFAARFYSSGVRSDFIDLMLTYDPNGIFAAGEGAFLLGISGNKFEPRKLNFETSSATDTQCKAEGDAECISGCCNQDSKDGLFQCSAECG